MASISRLRITPPRTYRIKTDKGRQGLPGPPGESAAALPIPASTMLGNLGTETAPPTHQESTAVLAWLDAATNASLNSLGSAVSSMGSSLVALQEIVNTKVSDGDSRLENAREWIAATVDQAEAELGIGTDRRAWTALRVRQSTRVNPDYDPTGNTFTIGTTTNAQRIRLRRRVVSGSDFSHLSIGWNSDTCQIQTQQAGNTPNPLVLGTNGVDRVFLSGTSAQVGIGAIPTTRLLELHDARPSIRSQVTSSTSPPVYSESARCFELYTFQDSTSPFNTFTDLVANSNQFNSHSIRIFVHANGTSAPIFSTMFYQTGRVGIGSEVDNNLGRLQLVQDNSGGQGLSHLTLRGVWNTTGTPTAIDVNLTDTTSDSASLLLNLRTNGVSRASVRKDGLLSVAGSISAGGSISCNDTFTLFDTILRRDAAGIIHQRNGTNGQIARWSRTWTADNNRTTIELDTINGASSFDLAMCSGAVGGTNIGFRIGSKYGGATMLTPFVSFATNGSTTWANSMDLMIPSETNTRETILRARVSDSGNDAFHIYNTTNVNGGFAPGFSGSRFSSNLFAMGFIAQTDAANDNGTNPLMLFEARRTSSQTDPNNGTISAITTRPLFAWQTVGAEYMRMFANGNLALNSTTDNGARLQVAGNVSIANTNWLSLDGGASTNLQNVGGWLTIRAFTGGNGTRLQNTVGTDVIRIQSNTTNAFVDGALTVSGNLSAANLTSTSGVLNLNGPSNPTASISAGGNLLITGFSALFGAQPVIIHPSQGLSLGSSAASSVRLSTQSAGVLSVSTYGGANGTGSISLTNLTASGSVGIGTSTPNAKLDVYDIFSGLANFTNTSPSSPSGGAGMIGYANDGAALANGDRLGFFLLGGSNSSSSVNNSCGIAGFATENWTSTACGARLELLVQPNGTSGTASRIAALTLNHNGQATFTSHVTSAFQSLSTDPSTIDIGSGLHRVVKNTTSGEVRDWVNDGGVMKKSPAYT